MVVHTQPANSSHGSAQAVLNVSTAALEDDLEFEQKLLLERAADIPWSLHFPEDNNSRKMELVDHGLESVIYDVWDTSILPFLSVPDIFQLCGVSKKVRRLLFNEWTFKRVCLVSTNPTIMCVFSETVYE